MKHEPGVLESERAAEYEADGLNVEIAMPFHLIPGQEANTVARFPQMLKDVNSAVIKAMGTAGAWIARQQWQQQSGHETAQSHATERDEKEAGKEETSSLKLLRNADLCEEVRDNAKKSESASCRARTYDPLIKSQEGYSANGNSETTYDDAKPSANCSDNSKGIIDPELATVLEAWPTLPEALRAGILAMVRAARR